MNLTFIIGNGFDIGLGLKTSYGDFLDDFLNPNADWSEGGKGIERLRRMISNDRLSWSDAELAFAKINFSKLGVFEDSPTSEDGEIHDYSAQDTYNRFIEKLSNYLQRQQQKLKTKIDRNLQIQFRKKLLSLKCIHLPFTPSQKEIVEPLNVNFINFNYTSTLDWLLGKTPLGCVDNDVSKKWGGPVSFNTPIHIHGELDNPEKMIFGVSYPAQIEHPHFWPFDEWAEKCLLKPDVLDSKEEGNPASALASAILKASDVVVLYGVSLGASDAIWWNHLGEMMMNGKIWLFYNDFNEIVQYPMPGAESKLQKQVQDKVLRAMEVGLEIREQIRKRILAISQGPVYYPDDTEQRRPIIGDPLCLKWFGEKLGVGHAEEEKAASMSLKPIPFKEPDPSQFIDAKEYGKREEDKNEP